MNTHNDSLLREECTFNARQAVFVYLLPATETTAVFNILSCRCRCERKNVFSEYAENPVIRVTEQSAGSFIVSLYSSM